MTKRHFETAAEIVREMRQYALTREHADAVGEAFSRLFSRYNGRFDRTRFEHACRGEDAYDSAGRKVRYGSR